MNFAVFQPTPTDPAPLEPYLTGKVVYEIGAGDGKFARKLETYSKQVFAIESDPVFAYECRLRGLATIEADVMSIPLKDADVIYFFLSFAGAYNITCKIQDENWHGTVISCYYPLHVVPGDYWKPDQIIHGELPFLIYHL